MVLLQGYGIGPSFAVKIYAEFGFSSAEVVVKDPYRLVEKVRGIGFATRRPDRHGLQGFPEDSPAPGPRLRCWTAWTAAAALSGHCFLPACRSLVAQGRGAAGPGIRRWSGRLWTPWPSSRRIVNRHGRRGRGGPCTSGGLWEPGAGAWPCMWAQAAGRRTPTCRRRLLKRLGKSSPPTGRVRTAGGEGLHPQQLAAVPGWR